MLFHAPVMEKSVGLRISIRLRNQSHISERFAARVILTICAWLIPLRSSTYRAPISLGITFYEARLPLPFHKPRAAEQVWSPVHPAPPPPPSDHQSPNIDNGPCPVLNEDSWKELQGTDQIFYLHPSGNQSLTCTENLCRNHKEASWRRGFLRNQPVMLKSNSR